MPGGDRRPGRSGGCVAAARVARGLVVGAVVVSTAFAGVGAIGALAPGAAPEPIAALAEGSETVDLWRRSRAEAPARLRAHAAWCAEQKLARERIAAMERLLALVPDDPEARRALRYVKTKDGTWKRTAGDEPPASPAESAADAARRLDEAVRPLRTSAARVFEDEELPMSQREQAMDDRLAIEPDDAGVRTANGETKSGERWILDETLRARERGKELRDAAAAARKASVAEATPPSDEESDLAARVAETFANDVVRVVGAEGTKEARAAAEVVAAARPLWEEAFASSAPRVPELRFFLFPSAAAGRAAVDRDPTFTPEDRAWVKTLSGAWRPKRNDHYIWDDQPVNRPEWALRQSVQVLIRTQFDVTEKRAWAYEGIGHWFSEVLLSAHHCTFVRRPEYADAGGADRRAERLAFLRASGDWMLAGRELAAKPEWPGVRAVLGKDVNGLAPDELLVSYVLSRYLIEGRPDVAVRAFGEAGRGTAPDAWAEGTIGWTVEGLDRRVRRWLREMGAK